MTGVQTCALPISEVTQQPDVTRKHEPARQSNVVLKHDLARQRDVAPAKEHARPVQSAHPVRKPVQKKIDPRKLVVYSEIMKPKFSE